jgi:hypothetical protein
VAGGADTYTSPGHSQFKMRARFDRVLSSTLGFFVNGSLRAEFGGGMMAQAAVHIVDGAIARSRRGSGWVRVPCVPVYIVGSCSHARRRTARVSGGWSTAGGAAHSGPRGHEQQGDTERALGKLVSQDRALQLHALEAHRAVVHPCPRAGPRAGISEPRPPNGTKALPACAGVTVRRRLQCPRTFPVLPTVTGVRGWASETPLGF